VPNPKLDVAAVIGQLGVGEALVSTLQDKGRSPVGPKYDKPVNRESAYEILGRRSGILGGARRR